MGICKLAPGFLALVLLLQVTIAASDRPYVNDPTCPRKPELARNRKCLKKCRTDLECRGRHKRCLCDDVCGRSCVKPTRRCESLKPIFNGKYEIMKFNTFGARARYTCNEGYILSGQPERVCQGDAYWSGEPPTCETEGKCRNPPAVAHAAHDGPLGQTIFPLGTQLTYTCENGYSIDGFFRAMCVGEGRWVGPRMTCSPRRCGHPGDIPNGHREGNVFVYPNRITYSCMDGYELVGRNYRVCQSDGIWSRSPPSCRPVKCPRLQGPANGHIQGSDSTYGAIARFTCLRGFTLIGSEARRCQNDGKWSGKDATCAMVDCGLPGPFYNGYLDGQQTTFGAILIFRCFGRTTVEGPTSSACLENGDWSHPLPKCWSKCEVPSVENGTISGYEPGLYVNHDKKVGYKCASGHDEYPSSEMECANGTWSITPQCIPAPCMKRPDELRDGMVRFYTLKHDDRAKYKCNTGFKLEGDQFMTCRYGKWVGNLPHCIPVYCPYPGTIENGQILLVGVIGKYEYRPYVRRIGHNEQIEFHCNKQYKRVGPIAATCVDGQWSPDNKPLCVAKKHPKLYIFRGKRSLPDENEIISMDKHIIDYDKGYCVVPNFRYGNVDNFRSGLYVPHGSQLKVTCHQGYRQPNGAEGAWCDDGIWTTDATCYPESWSNGT